MYYVKGQNKDGQTNTVYLDCEEIYGIVCDECGAEEALWAGEDFYNLIKEHGAYGVRWHCDSCTKEKDRLGDATPKTANQNTLSSL